ncbi:BSD domain-containing protein [Aspergillus ibericus CBS 121593]|uniref:BSD-domain-containing protein n=1 Tax=Aspergillus ibericus CBS 121593 TaxID=1448316 RepID=A0A395GPW6_9EURO|nr:BSD-domain-containing protein [Aspergillus ibericus CBS 121593]RAK97396.1 BSD-domain-containing protein [Aspergillus ibericus CBS 121593]
MDVAYDHIQEEIFSSNDSSKKEPSQNEPTTQDRPNVDLNAELQETFRAFSASPWGARIGGLWDNVRKQGESYYEGARQEYAAASEEAVKGFSDLKSSIVGRTRGLSLSTAFNNSGPSTATTSTDKSKEEAETSTPKAVEGGDEATATATAGSSEGFLSRFKAEAARRLKEIEKAEEAADEAILRFGMNIGQKLRDAVSIVPPSNESSDKLLFESKDAEGKRVIHATRFEAQLHVIHSNLESFSKDPVSDEWAVFKQSFNVDDKTDAIAADLEKYPELRSAMEKLVPEQVEYATFWSRYYFLRLVIETEEQKRKELLKDVNVDEEEVKWDDDSDDDNTDSPSTPQVKSSANKTATPAPTDKDTLKPTEPRRSNDQQSQPDSESSYDLVSGTTSRTPASPKEKPKDDESDDDWE